MATDREWAGVWRLEGGRGPGFLGPDALLTATRDRLTVLPTSQASRAPPYWSLSPICCRVKAPKLCARSLRERDCEEVTAFATHGDRAFLACRRFFQQGACLLKARWSPAPFPSKGKEGRWGRLEAGGPPGVGRELPGPVRLRGLPGPVGGRGDAGGRFPAAT